MDLYDVRQIEIRRKINFYFFVLMQISHSIMSKIKTRLSKIYGEGISCPVSIGDMTLNRLTFFGD